MNFSPQETLRQGRFRPDLNEGRARFEYVSRVHRVQATVAPKITNKSFRITAEIAIDNGDEGVIITQGGRFGGFGLVLLKGAPVWSYKLSQWDMPDQQLRMDGPKLKPGAHTVSIDFLYDYPRTLEEAKTAPLGRGGVFVMAVDGDIVKRSRIAKTVKVAFSVDESFDVGMDTGTPILEDYASKMPFSFTGTLDKVTLEILEPVGVAKDVLDYIADQLAEHQGNADLGVE